MRRRNPAKTTEQLIAMFKKLAADDPDFVSLHTMMTADPEFAGDFTTAVNAKIEKIDAAKAAKAHAAQAATEAAKAETPAAPSARSAGEGPLSDRQAWTMLADLVDTALADLTADERSALKAAFREEASRASS